LQTWEKNKTVLKKDKQLTKPWRRTVEMMGHGDEGISKLYLDKERGG
jgi:hypothetical protein